MWWRHVSRRAILAVCTAPLAAGATRPLFAQSAGAPSYTAGLSPAALVGVNVALGAGVAGVHAWHDGRPVRAALWRGALGGTVMAGGFAVSTWSADIARLATGQIVAVGASMARNAGSGRPLFETVTLPLAPLLVEHQHDTTGQGHWRVRLSAGTLWGLAERGMAHQGMQVDWAASASTGALVFRTHDAGFSMGVNCPVGVPCVRAGNANLGTIAYAAGRTPGERHATLTHEAVHVAQRSRDLILLGEPLGDWLTARKGPGRRLGRVLVIDGLMPLDWVDQATALMGSGYQSWYEREARTVAPGSAGSFRAPKGSQNL
jgi:hypothetical protein